jgi:beta-lactamase regulating signal transducer with metallopeptidase domain/biopolymer transport protein ExbD
MNALTELLWLPWAECLLKGAAICAATLLLLGLLGRASAGQRNLLLRLVFGLLLVLPATAWLPALYRVPWPRAETPAPVRVEAVAVAMTPVAPAAETVVPASSAPPAPRPQNLPWATISLLVWAGGCASLLAWQLAGLMSLARLRRDAREIRDEAFQELAEPLLAEFKLRPNLRFLESAQTRVPLTWGTLRPIVLLPAGWRELPPAQLESVLRHELGHVAQADFLGRLVAGLVTAFNWPNPLAWLLARKLRLAQEQACDDLALGSRGITPEAYAQLLLQTARLLGAPAGTRTALAMATPSTLERRLLAVMDATRNRRRPGQPALLLGSCVLGSLLVLLGGGRIGAAPAPSPALAAEVAPPEAITISTRFIELPPAALDTLVRKLGNSPESFRRFEPVSDSYLEKFLQALGEIPEAELLAAPSVTARSGQKAIITSAPAPTSPELTLEILPSIVRQKVDLAVGMKVRWEGQPETELSLDGVLGKGGQAVITAEPDAGRQRVPLLIVELGEVAAAPESEAARIGKVIIPELKLEGADLLSALDQLQTAARAADPEQRGVVLAVMKHSVTGFLPEKNQLAISGHFKGHSVRELLRHFTDLAGARLTESEIAYSIAPEEPEDVLVRAPEPIHVEITSKGTVLLEGVPVDAETLSSKLAAQKPETVVVTASSMARMEQIKRVLDACAAAGVRDIDFKSTAGPAPVPGQGADGPGQPGPLTVPLPPLPPGPVPRVIRLHKDGKVTIDDKVIILKDLRSELERNRPVTVRFLAGPDVPYEVIKEAAEQAAVAGLGDVRFEVAENTASAPDTAPREVLILRGGKVKMEGAELDLESFAKRVKVLNTGGNSVAIVLIAPEGVASPEVEAVVRASDGAGARKTAVVRRGEPETPPAPAPDQAYLSKISHLIIPEVNFQQKPLGEALQWLVEQSRAVDPAKKGINLVVREPESKAATPITLRLNNIPVADAIRYATSLADAKMEVGTDAIAISW